jgi:hypothetical protein
MPDDLPRFSPNALRHRDPHEVLDPILSNPAALTRIRESLAYFDEGNAGVPWEEVEAKMRERRGKRAI